MASTTSMMANNGQEWELERESELRLEVEDQTISLTVQFLNFASFSTHHIACSFCLEQLKYLAPNWPLSGNTSLQNRSSPFLHGMAASCVQAVNALCHIYQMKHPWFPTSTFMDGSRHDATKLPSRIAWAPGYTLLSQVIFSVDLYGS